MTPVPCIPESAPFTAEQRLWLNGYLAGLFSNANLAVPTSMAKAGAPPKSVTILYGSQTGTAEGLAKKVAHAATQRGCAPRVVCMEKFRDLELPREERLLVITSTYGDGEPPDNARDFWNFLASDNAPKLDQVRYSVLALGDSNYPAFCQFGKLCDERFTQLGARCLHARVDCDVDYDAAAQTWTDEVLASLAETGLDEASIPAAETSAETSYSRKNPFSARLITNRLLSGAASSKEVRHYEISLEGSALDYEVGDALGVVPANCPALVSDLLAVLGCDGEEAVAVPGVGETSLRLALSQHYDICRPSADFLNAVATRSSDAELRALVEPGQRDELKKFLWGREVIDVLARVTSMLGATEFVSLLKKLQPRLYSISSSPKAHPGEVHLTIATVRYEAHGRTRKGICSTFLADRCGEPARTPVFVQTSHGFRIPADPQRAMIMVGPGTGVAPFRAFLEERRAIGAPGRNWLFFGDQRRATDYLYESELEAMRADGHLSRLDLAFSRDQADKIYVQNRMLENGPELWSWLENGAHLYVCGDASRMAKDVDAALHQVCETAGSLSEDAAAEYVAKLKAEKRYQRDVY